MFGDDKEQKVFLNTLAGVFTVIFIIGFVHNCSRTQPTSPPDQKEALNRLRIDSIKSHHVIKRQNEIILDYKKNKDFRILKEINN